MEFFINTVNDAGSGMTYDTKEEFLKEISAMVDDCIQNGGTFMEVVIDADASCFYQESGQKDAEPVKAAEPENNFRVKMPGGYLFAEAKGSEDEYPGVFISFLKDSMQGNIDNIIACVEYDSCAGLIKTESYKADCEEPCSIIAFNDEEDNTSTLSAGEVLEKFYDPPEVLDRRTLVGQTASAICDFVLCTNCNKRMLVDHGEDSCPECRCKGSLVPFVEGVAELNHENAAEQLFKHGYRLRKEL